MRLALGVVMLWLGSALLYIATHSTGAASPWQAYQMIIGTIRGDNG